jgi:hypothetical protein
MRSANAILKPKDKKPRDTSSTPGGDTCFCCGNSGHLAKDCKFSTHPWANLQRFIRYEDSIMGKALKEATNGNLTRIPLSGKVSEFPSKEVRERADKAASAAKDKFKQAKSKDDASKKKRGGKVLLTLNEVLVEGNELLLSEEAKPINV